MAAITYALVGFVLIEICISVALYVFRPRDKTEEDLKRGQRAIVLVLGDIGHSPRMSFHALSLAKSNINVDLCGYSESEPMDAVKKHPNITIHPIPVISNTQKLPFVLFAPYKVIKQHLILFKLLRSLNGADYLFVQNPPSIPALGMARFFCLFMTPGCRLIIDWHNLGYSILALKLGKRHPFVWVYRMYEKIMGRIAFIHLTVSIAMGTELRRDFGMNARRIIPLYDAAGPQFHVLADSEKVIMFDKYFDTLFDKFDRSQDKLVVVSTSYTPDEDLMVLLYALKQYCADNSRGPHIRVVVTGKGPMETEMKREMVSLEKELGGRVTFRTAWLPYEDYPLLIGSADVGISLHTSSSGFDLPMKVVDLFGCGVPVVALGFPALPELVKDGDNGLIVHDSDAMAGALEKLFNGGDLLRKLTEGARRTARLKWDTNWTEKLGPLFGIGKYRERSGYSDTSSSDSD